MCSGGNFTLEHFRFWWSYDAQKSMEVPLWTLKKDIRKMMADDGMVGGVVDARVQTVSLIGTPVGCEGEPV